MKLKYIVSLWIWGNLIGGCNQQREEERLLPSISKPQERGVEISLSGEMSSFTPTDDGLRTINNTHTAWGVKPSPHFADKTHPAILILRNKIDNQAVRVKVNLNTDQNARTFELESFRIPHFGTDAAELPPGDWYAMLVSSDMADNVSETKILGATIIEPTLIARDRHITYSMPYMSEWIRVAFSNGDRSKASISGVKLRPCGTVFQIKITCTSRQAPISLDELVLSSNFAPLNGYINLENNDWASWGNTNDMPIWTTSQKLKEGTTLTTEKLLANPTQAQSAGVILQRNQSAESFYVSIPCLYATDVRDPYIQIGAKAHPVGQAPSDAAKRLWSSKLSGKDLGQLRGKVIKLNLTIGDAFFKGQNSATTPDEPKESDRAGKTFFVYGTNAPSPDKFGYNYWSTNLVLFGIKWKPNKNYHWYDANKENARVGGVDSNMCWAASVANSMNWWLDLTQNCH